LCRAANQVLTDGVRVYAAASAVLKAGGLTVAAALAAALEDWDRTAADAKAVWVPIDDLAGGAAMDKV